MDSLVIFHYHLLRGGVTNVISLSVQALCRHSDRVGSITLVAGRRENAHETYEALVPTAQAHGTQLNVEIVPELDYVGGKDVSDHPTADHIAEELLRRFGGRIWWVHNYQLGKNPLFTQALLAVADRHPDQRMLFHIHDFPECSRYRNLSYLNSHITLPPYPVRPNVRYAVINGRDKRLLENAGIPNQHLFLLNNPVDASPVDRSKSLETRRALKQHFGKRFSRFSAERPTLLYPVRTIRRKNALELALLAQISEESPNLIITLPGTSATEKPYSDIVERAYAERLVPGLWGIGAELDDTNIGFMDIVGSADAIAASSVQEGFGYLYINAVQWGFPLFARRLDILDGIMDVFNVSHARFYDTIRVPVTDQEKDRLSAAYTQKIDDLAEFLPAQTLEKLRTEIHETMEKETIDFSYLSAEIQYSRLQQANKDPEYAGTLRSLNRGALRDLTDLVTYKQDVPVSEIDQRFTFAGFARTVESIADSFGAAAPAQSSAPPVQERLIDSFAEKEYIRLLYS